MATVTGHVVCLNWVGLDCSKTIVINEEAAAAVAATTSTTGKPRTRKATNKGENKKITEYYRKQVPKETGKAVGEGEPMQSRATVAVPKVAETLKEPTESARASTENTCNIGANSKKRTLDLFQFGQKSKLSRNSSFNSTAGSDTTLLDISNKFSGNEPHVEVLRIPSEATNCSKEILNDNDSGIWDVVEIMPKKKSPDQESRTKNSYFSRAPTQKAAPAKEVSSVQNSNRNFIELFRRDPFLLFGRPEDFKALRKQPQGGTMRRVCIFGVFREVPRDKERCFAAGSASKNEVVMNNGIAEGETKEIDRFCPQIEVVQEDGQSRKKLDLG